MRDWILAIDTFHRCTVTPVDMSQPANKLTSKINRKSLEIKEEENDAKKKKDVEDSYNSNA